MEHTTHDLKRLGLGFLLLIVGILGIIAGFASAKYGALSDQPLYLLAGIVNFVVVAYGGYQFFNKHLKY